MASPLSIRLDEKTRQRISRLARRKKMSVSDVVRNAIESMAGREESPAAPYVLVADLIGSVRGKNPRRSEQTGRGFTKILKRARKSR
jgi:predicted DNA-binding protein